MCHHESNSTSKMPNLRQAINFHDFERNNSTASCRTAEIEATAKMVHLHRHHHANEKRLNVHLSDEPALADDPTIPIPAITAATSMHQLKETAVDINRALIATKTYASRPPKKYIYALADSTNTIAIAAV